MDNNIIDNETNKSVNDHTQIEIKHLTKIYPIPTGEVVALNDINLEIEKGDIYGIIGMSGAGKSTLVRCINKLDTPTDGQIFIDGENILLKSPADLRTVRRRMAMIFQSFNLLMQKNVSKNVRYPLEIAGVPKNEANKRVKELLSIVGLDSKANSYPSQLSGGQKQRVAIARALASNPEVLLCDEATSALDPMTTQSILTLLQDINKRLGITVVIITHEMAVIRQICNKVAILENGKLEEKGTVDDVFMHTKSPAGKRLFGIVQDEETSFDLSQPALRIVFDGTTIDHPVISRLIRKFDIDINILSADIKKLNGKTYGQVIFEMPEDHILCNDIKEYIEGLKLTIEEVR